MNRQGEHLKEDSLCDECRKRPRLKAKNGKGFAGSLFCKQCTEKIVRRNEKLLKKQGIIFPANARHNFLGE